MSHELILAAGEASDAHARKRRCAVKHAAGALPGVDRIKMHETSHACIALVSTTPAGGDVANLTVLDHGCRATVALTPSGLKAAKRGISNRVGSESGHATMSVTVDGRVEITTDGFATVGTYWAEYEDSLLVATHLASLVSLGLPPTIDQQGAIEYLAMMHPLGARTTLEGASLLQPGSTLSWSVDRLDLRCHPIFVPGPAYGDSRATMAEFHGVWKEVISDAVERSRSDRLLIGLSGGLDSRIVAAQWVRSGERPIAYTYGYQTSYEVRVASEVASRLSIPHLQLPVTDNHLLAGADSMAHLLDGAHAPAKMYELWFADRLRSVADVIANGLAGGKLMGDEKLIRVVNIDSQVELVWRRFASDVAETSPFVSTGIRDDMAAIVKTSIERSLQEFADLGRADSGLFWNIANRQFRWGNMFYSALRRIGIRTETPFIDGRFLAFAARLTPEQRLNGTFYLSVQRSLFPEVADVARSDDGNSPVHLDHAYWSGDRSFLRQLVELGSRHPVSATRRGYRRAASQAARRGAHFNTLESVSDRLRLRQDVFPADIFLRGRPVYATRLADLIEAARGTTSVLDDGVIGQAVQAIRAGEPAHSAASMGRVAALGAWARDYRERADKYTSSAESPDPVL